MIYWILASKLIFPWFFSNWFLQSFGARPEKAQVAMCSWMSSSVKLLSMGLKSIRAPERPSIDARVYQLWQGYGRDKRTGERTDKTW